MYLRGYVNALEGRSWLQCCFVQCKFHVDWPVIEPGPCMYAVGILCNLSEYWSRISDSYIEYKSNELSVSMFDRIFKIQSF
jgi:hypothetical protein